MRINDDVTDESGCDDSQRKVGKTLEKVRGGYVFGSGLG